jgi:ribosomal protein S18 acetylase RimI-like enzyme
LFREQAEYQRELSPYFQLKQDIDWTAKISSMIHQPCGAIFVCQRDAAIAGYISVRLIHEGLKRPRQSLRGWIRSFRKAKQGGPNKVFAPRRYGFVEDWYLIPQLRGQGIGRQLWEAAQQWFEQINVKEVDTTVWINNEQSFQAFQRLGFHTVRVMMRKSLR